MVTLKSVGKQWHKSYWNGYECNLTNNPNFASKEKAHWRSSPSYLLAKPAWILILPITKPLSLYFYFSPPNHYPWWHCPNHVEVLMRLECVYIKLGFKCSKKNCCLKGPHKKIFKGKEHMCDINNTFPKWWNYSKGPARRCGFQPLFWQ